MAPSPDEKWLFIHCADCDTYDGICPARVANKARMLSYAHAVFFEAVKKLHHQHDVSTMVLPPFNVILRKTELLEFKKDLENANELAFFFDGRLGGVSPIHNKRIEIKTSAPAPTNGESGELFWAFRKWGIPHINLTHDYMTKIQWACARMILPMIPTPANIETVTMSLSWLWRYLENIKTEDSFDPSKRQTAILICANYLAQKTELVFELLREYSYSMGDETHRWSLLWHDSAFARLEIPEKLAASFVLTDAPSVPCSWGAVSIIMPPNVCEPVRRIWCWNNQETGMIEVNASVSSGKGHLVRRPEIEKHQLEILTRIARSAMFALGENPKPVRNAKPFENASKRKGGTPSGALYRIGSTIKIDLRKEATEAWEGKSRKGVSPTVQFVVRGHWRNQACGTGQRSRRRIHIEPYWKGPEESRVLLRTHSIEKETKNDTEQAST